MKNKSQFKFTQLYEKTKNKFSPTKTGLKYGLKSSLDTHYRSGQNILTLPMASSVPKFNYSKFGTMNSYSVENLSNYYDGGPLNIDFKKDGRDQNS